MFTANRTLHRSRLAGLALLLGAAALLWPSATWAKAPEDLRLVATLPDLGAIARVVAGPEVDIRVIASPSEDPHYVDPRPDRLVVLSRADLLIANGLGLEVGWLPTLRNNARNGRILAGSDGYLDASTVIVPLNVRTGAALDRSQGDIHAGGNPHYMFSPDEALRVAGAIRDRLNLIAPEHRGRWESNYAKFAVEATGLSARMKRRFATLDPAKRKVVTYHASLPYLAKWLGLTIVDQVEPKPGVPPSPRDVAVVLKRMQTDSIRLIVQESYYPSNTSKALARLAGAKLLILQSATDFAGGETYLAHVSQIAEGLYDAMVH